MTKQAILLTTVLALCAGSAVVFALGPEPTPGPAAALGGGVAPDAPADSTTEEAFAELGGDPLDDGTITEREELVFTGNAVSITEGHDGATLRIVAAATGRPVPGAEVFAAELPRNWQGNRRIRELEGHWSELLMAKVRAVLADGDGRVALPAIQRRLVVAAQAPGLFGVATYGPDIGAGATLALDADQNVFVRVVDARGAPVPDLKVALCTDIGRQLRHKTGVTTDADGWAELRHLQLFRDKAPVVDPVAAAARAEFAAQREALASQAVSIAIGDDGRLRIRSRDGEQVRFQMRRAVIELMRDRGRLERQARNTESKQLRGPDRDTLPDADFVVVAQTPQLEPALARFAALAPPRDAITLRLAGAGSLVVHVNGPDGEPLLGPCEVIVRTAQSTPAPNVVGPELGQSLRAITALRAAKPLATDAVRFPVVGAGLELDVHVRFRDDDFNFVATGQRGPLAAEEHELVVSSPSWFSVIAGRLIDTMGVAQPGVAAELFVAGAAGRVEGERIETDLHGRFELPVRLRRAAPPYTLEVSTRRGDRRAGALLELRDLEPGRRHELGDVVLDGPPMLAHGVVRDDVGEPVRHARVSLQSYRVGDGEGAAWVDEAYVSATTDGEGAFALFGHPRGARMRLVARARDHVPLERPEIPFGAEQDLVLERVGRIEGNGWLPRLAARTPVQAELAREGQKVREDRLRTGPDGAFRLRYPGLRAGRYTLAIVLSGEPRPLALLDDIVVEPGAAADDSRLRDIDLRPRLHHFVVHAVDQNGEAVRPRSPLVVTRFGADGAPKKVAYSWQGKTIEFWAMEPTVEAVALDYGRRPAATWLNAGENRVVLRSLHPVEVRIPGMRALVGPERRVRISMVYEGDTGIPMTDTDTVDQVNGRRGGVPRASLGKAGGGDLSGDDTTRVPLMLNGRYRVVARFYAAGAPGPQSVTVGHADVVLDGPQAPVVTLDPPAARVQSALAELAAQRAAAEAQRAASPQRGPGRRR